jgi:starch phosphorylase
VAYPVKFYGHVSVQEGSDGRQTFNWSAGEEVTAVAYDNPIPGFKTQSTINLRLWAAKPCQEFDLEAFNTGDYVSSIIDKQKAETITSVLYPDDKTFEGKELRLKQQHFMVSATLQDIVRRYKEQHNTFEDFPEKVAMQLNDTHPTLGIPELMRILMDENQLGWTKSWEITTKVFSFTNHTVLPEALEQWPVNLMEKLLPRHMQIIYDINWRYLQELKNNYGIDGDRLGRMSIIAETEYGKTVRMAYLALVASHTVNGVAAIHSKLIKETIFKDFHDIWPEKFQNKTNGVTQRRWLAQCNPPLNRLITETLGTEAWITHLDLLKGLKDHADDKEFQQKWASVKKEAKTNLAQLLKQLTGDDVNMDAIFDVQVKRIHEYKRQLMNILSVALRYDRIKSMSPEEKKNVVPRVIIIGGKAAPGYDLAKRIIKLISAVSETVNNDADIGDLLKVYFVPDYNVSLAEVIVPGSDINQQISTAGTEASGTSNMKFAMNGSLIIGTMDGANVEIAEEIGEENMFIFGVRAEEVPSLREQREYLQVDPQFEHATNLIRNGHFGWADYFQPLIDSITGSRDYYLLANDFSSYLEAQERVDSEWKDRKSWIKKSILSTAGSGKFSSDRTIHEYAEEIWNVKPIPPEA